MGALHIAGFEIPVHREGQETMSGQQGQPMRALDGTPTGGVFSDVEGGTFATPLIRLTEARSIANLCRGANGHHWDLENASGGGRYASSGLQMTGSPTFQTGTVKFGTYAISLSAGGGDVDVATVTTSALSEHTVAAWTKDGSGDWEHHILRSDGAKWVDGVRNDGATLLFEVSANVWTLLDDGSNIRYFDDLVWLPFAIYDDWGAGWIQTEAFSPLPDLKVWGDLFGDWQFSARVRARLQHMGQAVFGGTATNSAKVMLTVTGGARSSRA